MIGYDLSLAIFITPATTIQFTNTFIIVIIAYFIIKIILIGIKLQHKTLICEINLLDLLCILINFIKLELC